jgi:hypothetical protein
MPADADLTADANVRDLLASPSIADPGKIPSLPTEIIAAILQYAAQSLEDLQRISLISRQIHSLTWLSPSFIADYTLYRPLRKHVDDSLYDDSSQTSISLWSDRFNHLVHSEYSFQNKRHYNITPSVPDLESTWKCIVSKDRFTPKIYPGAFFAYLSQHCESLPPSLEVVRLLKKKGFPVSPATRRYACTLGNVEVMNAILELASVTKIAASKASVSSTASNLFDDQRVSCGEGHESPKAQTPLYIKLEYKTEIWPMLMEIICSGHIILLQNMFNIHCWTWDDVGKLGSSLFLAISQALSGECLDMVEYIICNTQGYEWGRKLRSSVCSVSLVTAICNGRCNILRFLHDRIGADLMKLDEGRQSLMHYVKDAETLDYLWQYGEFRSVDVKSDDGKTPLMMAAENGYIGVVKRLLVLGADHSVRDMNERTALDYAMDENQTEVISFLSYLDVRSNTNFI